MIKQFTHSIDTTMPKTSNTRVSATKALQINGQKLTMNLFNSKKKGWERNTKLTSRRYTLTMPQKEWTLLIWFLTSVQPAFRQSKLKCPLAHTLLTSQPNHIKACPLTSISQVFHLKTQQENWTMNLLDPCY